MTNNVDKKIAKDDIKAQLLSSSDNEIYEIRESGLEHSAFRLEFLLYSAIKEGNVDNVERAIDNYLKEGLVIGSMSSNSLSQIRYWAVATISIGVHYAILGGLDETIAYTLSDSYIRHIDRQNNLSDCVLYLKEKAIELTKKVSQSRNNPSYSPSISKCLHYIQNHLHERLRIEDTASNLGFSRDYLSHIFKKEVGISLHKYIVDEKLKEAKTMLEMGEPINKVSYTLCFANESHFVQCYKKKYGITPGSI